MKTNFELVSALTLHKNNPERFVQLFLDAAAQGKTDLLQSLLDAGVDVNEADGEGVTAAMRAAHKGHGSTLRLLADRGANLDAVDAYGQNTLMYAILGGDMDTIRLAIDRTRNLDADNSNGDTAALLVARNMARREDACEVTRLLAKRGANLNIANKKRETALMWAVQRDDIGAVQVQLENGADVNAFNKKEGHTALTLTVAPGKRQYEIGQLLVKHGARFDAARRLDGTPVNGRPSWFSPVRQLARACGLGRS